MLHNRNILCMSNPSWDGDYAKTIVEMMRLFAVENKVLYIENPATWLDVWRFLRRKEWGKLKLLFSSGARKIVEGEAVIHVANPGPVLPVNFLPHNFLYKILLRWNNGLVRRRVKRMLRNLGMEEQLIHINAFNPMLARNIMGHLKESVTLYYCYDEIEAAAYMKDHGTFIEPNLLRKADLTVVSSEGLYEKKKPKAKRIALVKNGVDFDLFSKGFKEEKPEKPLIGYIGSIDDRMDLDILRFCMEAHPEWTFEFVGRVNDEAVKEFLKSMPNIQLRGSHNTDKLPGFLEHYSAGIIPFVRNEFTKGIYPLKINEYLAAGLPVVLTKFGMLDEFESVASICISKESFLEALEKEIKSDTSGKRKKRRTFASNNAWKARAEVLSSEIEKIEHEHEAQLG